MHYKLTVCPRLGPRKKKTTTAGDLSFNHHRRERINSPEWTLSGPGAVRYQHRRFTQREKEKKGKEPQNFILFFLQNAVRMKVMRLGQQINTFGTGTTIFSSRNLSFIIISIYLRSPCNIMPRKKKERKNEEDEKNSIKRSVELMATHAYREQRVRQQKREQPPPHTI